MKKIILLMICIFLISCTTKDIENPESIVCDTIDNCNSFEKIEGLSSGCHYMVFVIGGTYTEDKGFVGNSYSSFLIDLPIDKFVTYDIIDDGLKQQIKLIQKNNKSEYIFKNFAVTNIYKMSCSPYLIKKEK